MIPPPRLGRRNPQVLRSQLALEVALLAYAAIGTAIVLRLVFGVLGISARVWSGSVVYRLTDPIVWPLTLVPGGDRRLVGDAGLPELTTAAVVALVPLALLARPRSRPR